MTEQGKVTAVTPMPWRRDGSSVNPSGEHAVYLVGGNDGEHPTIFIASYCRTQEDKDQFEANVDAVIALTEAAASINPTNPKAVADEIGEAFAQITALVEKAPFERPEVFDDWGYVGDTRDDDASTAYDQALFDAAKPLRALLSRITPEEKKPDA